jgi:hypothetical protein
MCCCGVLQNVRNGTTAATPQVLQSHSSHTAHSATPVDRSAGDQHTSLNGAQSPSGDVPIGKHPHFTCVILKNAP